MAACDSYLSERMISFRDRLFIKYLFVYWFYIVPFSLLKSLLGEGGGSIIGKHILQLSKWKWEKGMKEGN